MQSVPETDLIYSGRAARALERTCGRVWHAEQDGGTGSRNFREEKKWSRSRALDRSRVWTAREQS